MKRILLIHALLVWAGLAAAQTREAQANPSNDSNIVFTFVEQMPDFPGGQHALMTYLKQHLQYPQGAQQKGIGARIVIRFVVWRDGSIRKAEIVSSNCISGADCAAMKNEALRAVNAMPQWKPGKKNGRTVNVYYTLPVTFQPGSTEELEGETLVPPPPPDVPVQTGRTGTGSEEEAFAIVEQMPEFPGGNDALRKYLDVNLKYPAIALENKVSGRVFVKFVVTKEGNVKDVQVIKGCRSNHAEACAAIDKEAVRLVKAMPKWKPGMQNGRAVDVYFNLPISFNPPADKAIAADEQAPKVVEEQAPAALKEEVFLHVSEMPQFPGGDIALQEYLSKNLVYPDSARAQNASGKVVVRFIVGNDGSIRNASVVRQDCLNNSNNSACTAMKNEALRVIGQMPKWRPGKQNGKHVSVCTTLPVVFRLD